MGIRLTVPEEQRLDRAYWDQPLALRIYFRLLYGVSGCIVAGCGMGLLGAPGWMQWTVGGLVCVCALIFRMAFPNGMMNVQTWMNEGMLEAAKELAKKDKGYKFDTSIPSPEQLEEKLRVQKEIKEKKQDQARKAAAVKEARKKNRKNR